MGIPLRYNLRNLSERKATTLMTAVGIGLTVAVLVTSLALVQGLSRVFSATVDPRQFLVLRKGTNAELTSSVSNDALQIIRTLPGIAQNAAQEPFVSPEQLSVVNLPSIDSPEGMNVTVRGLLPIGLSMREIKIEQGKMFEPGLRQVVVGSSIARRYPDAQIGKQLHFGRGSWEVVGVFSVGDSAVNNEIWADLNQLRGDFDRAGASSSLLVRAQSPADIEALDKTISNDQRLGVNTVTEQKYYADLTITTAQPLMIIGFFVATIMAVGSAFAATNTMYAAVARRAREIGTLRALGFSRFSILVSFMLESVCLALLGGAVGALLALPINGISTGIGNFQTFSDIAFQFRVSPLAMGVGFLFAAIIGAIGGFLPAWAASRKTIVQAMREA